MERLLWQSLADPRARCAFARWRVALALWLLGWVVPAAAASFTASLDRDTIMLGDSVRLSLTFEGGQPKSIPSLPGIPNLQIGYNGQSSQFNSINGQVSQSFTHNFTVTPRQIGDYTIPALTCEMGGQTFTTPALRLKVVKPNAPPPEAAAASGQPAFLRLVLPKTNLFLGEILVGELQLYLRDGVQGLNQFQFTGTPAEGFSIGKMAEGQRRRVQVGGAGYTLIPVSVVFTPVKTGPLSIGPITASVVIEVPNSRRRGTAFDPFGMFGEQQKLALATDSASVACAPLPTEHRPDNFSGAVGNFTLTVSVGPTNVATGDPITVRVQISGRGALDAITLPPQVAWHDFKAYPPTAKVETADALGLQGTKIFEQVISPESTDIKELPAFSFSFFNPDVQQYQTLTHPATALTVRPGGAAVAPVIAATRLTTPENAPPQQDIVPIKQRLGALRPIEVPRSRYSTYVALNVAPVLAFLGVAVWRKRTDALANNPRLRRQRQVAETVRTGLERLRTLAAANQSDEFFAQFVRLLQEKLGERLDCPASAITEAVIDDRLRPRGVPDTTLEALHELFQTSNLARYAPFKSSQELAAVIPKLESALQKLDEVKA
jgi:hypothetical protein